MRSVASWANRLLLLTLFVVALAPMWFMATGSVQNIEGIFVMPPRLFPRSVSMAQYEELISSVGFVRWIGNSLVVLALTVAGAVVVSCSAGYAFAFYPIPAKRVLWVVLLAGLLLPRISLIIPQFVVFQRLGINGTLFAVVLPIAYSPVGIFLARTFFATVPGAMLESARMDGASELQVLVRIVAPIARPVVVTIALFVSLAALGDFLWQMLQLQRVESMTLLIGVTRMAVRRGIGAEGHIVHLSRQMAAGMILLAPLLVVFGIANRYFTASIGGAIKE